MKILPLITLVLCLCAFKVPSAETYTITVEVEGIKKPTGTVLLALYNSEETYLSEEDNDVFRWGKQEVKGKTVTIVFKNVPKGTYTFAGFHDENGNEEMDKSFGIPKEGYCFSNNAKVSFGPPDYEEAAFTLEKDMFQKIQLNFGI